MSNYVPLYRKYRPQSLDTLVGQEHVKKTLTSAIELGKISHAYLFTGPRGTGKTSTARILAKSLNCKNGPTIHPCGECASCKDITNSIPIDVIEIDAASNRKVEDAQNILEKVQYVPVNGKYKIYIIDEVHMLTNHAFNALLKTLEEPPENVIFILATTEVHKVLDTIKSRCQRFDFRRITTDDIIKHLKFISDSENINISEDALFAIAKNSAGGMRDSISLLDQLSLLGVSKQITVDDVNAILGRISFDTLFKLTETIINSSSSQAIELLNDIYNSGNEPLQILTNLSEYFKNLLIIKNCSKELLPELTGLNAPQIEELVKQKDRLETQQIVFLIERTSYYIKEIKQATNQHLWLEIGIIDLSNMTENSTLLDLQNRVRAIENGNINVVQNSPVVTRPAPIQPNPVDKARPVQKHVTQNIQQVAEVRVETKDEKIEEDDFTPPPMSKKRDGNDLGSLWGTLLSNIKSQPTQALLKQQATPIKIAEDGVVLTLKNDQLVSMINNTNKKQMVVEAAQIMFGNAVDVTIKKGDGSEVAVTPVQNVQPRQESVKKQKEPIEQVTKAEETTIEKKSDKIDIKPEQITEKNSITSSTEYFIDKINLENNMAKKNIDRIESDQERMVIELFDGKYVE